MRFWATAICSMLALALPHATSAPTSTAHQRRNIEILTYEPDIAFTSFSLNLGTNGADEAFIFDLQVNAVTIPLISSELILNDQHLNLEWHAGQTHHNASLATKVVAEDSLSFVHDINVTVSGLSPPTGEGDSSGDGVVQRLEFSITAIDDKPARDLGFVVFTQPTAPHRLKTIQRMMYADSMAFDKLGDQYDVADKESDEMIDAEESEGPFDLEAELQTLSLLESKAESLHAEISAKKKAISSHLMQHREHVSLSHLLEECDGLICAAKVVAQRICRKVGIATDPWKDDWQRHNSHFQEVVGFGGSDSKLQAASRNFTKTNPSQHGHGWNPSGRKGQAASIPVFQTKNSTTPQYQFIDLEETFSPSVVALGVIASALGLIALLFKCIRRKCMSMRKRVERAADKEERRNARAYRRAARRAHMRRRWDGFINTISCFRAPPEPRFEDYEEKRALILQDAFLEQLDDMENAEKGELMEAEIRELRHAQEIVASLVRVDEHRYGFATAPPMMHDPPPPLVPLPIFTPAEARSRASTHTLPSYTSESLPDYSSQPETPIDSSTNSVVDGFTHYTPPSTNGDSLASTSSASGGDASSIVDVSPRVSAETLRTRQSKDSRD